MKVEEPATYYMCGTKLEKTDRETLAKEGRDCIVITESAYADEVLTCLDTVYEEELAHVWTIDVKGIRYCRAESQNDLMSGSFCIPRFLDVSESCYRMFFMMGRHFLLLISDDGFAHRIVKRIRRNKMNQGDCQVRFFYNFVTEFMNQDIALLENYERRLMCLEEEILQGRFEDIMGRLMTIRKSLRILQGYYEQMQDTVHAFWDNENDMFSKKQLRYFGVLEKRAQRLYEKTVHFLDYADEVRGVYQAQMDDRQNRTMHFLTVISTIFLPLTLITSWYGMNFQNMPEMETGYPYVILLCLLVVILSVWMFKRKRFW